MISLTLDNELSQLLELLQKVNQCNQSYESLNESVVISYKLKINLLNFLGKIPLNASVEVIGLPISICEKGYYGNIKSIIKMIEDKKGLKIVLNADEDLGCKGRTLSTFIFYNRFDTLEEYINALRSPYRRRVKKTLDYRSKLIIKELKNTDFNHNHYLLYKSIMERTKNPLETLDINFFKMYDADIYEFIDVETSKLLGFIQLKEVKDVLYFLFCGFKREDNEGNELYNNMLLKVIEVGIQRGIKTINFGQTSEETKLKLGCEEVEKYLGVYHSNKLLNKSLQLLLPMFSYKPYKVKHRVFKEDDE